MARDHAIATRVGGRQCEISQAHPVIELVSPLFDSVAAFTLFKSLAFGGPLGPIERRAQALFARIKKERQVRLQTTRGHMIDHPDLLDIPAEAVTLVGQT